MSIHHHVADAATSVAIDDANAMTDTIDVARHAEGHTGPQHYYYWYCYFFCTMTPDSRNVLPPTMTRASTTTA